MLGVKKQNIRPNITKSYCEQARYKTNIKINI